jgi:crotonobetainyl-CoA:carnitine CoA-transferase CaiB-like acyl-CoA transferase
VQTEGHFDNFCRAIGQPDLLEDPRFGTLEARTANTRECIAALDDIFAKRDLAEWQNLLEGLSTPWTVIQTAGEAATDPQVTANQFMTEVAGDGRTYRLAASPAQFDGVPPSLRPAPEHGQHTEEILLELGRTWEDIAELKVRGAVL